MSREALRSSYSQITTFRSCPQKWQYGTVRGLSPDRGPITELEFGSWWHALKAAESIDRGRMAESLRYCPNTIKLPGNVRIGTEEDGKSLQKKFWDALRVSWDRTEGEDRERWLEAYGEPIEDRLRQIQQDWWQEWMDEIEEEEPLAVEMRWERPLPGLLEEPEVILVGYVDEVFWHPRKRMIVIRDHKTGKNLPTQSAVEDLMESQLHLYAWGAAPQINEWGLGRIGAVAYDRVRSAASKEPKLNLDGTLSKTITDFNLSSYLNWVGKGREYPGRKKDGSGAGVYAAEPELVEKLSSDVERSKWLQRTLTPLNKHVIRAHLQASIDTVQHQLRVRDYAERTGEAPRNLGRNCERCDFVQLCRAEILGGVMDDIPYEEFRLKPRSKDRG